MIFFIFIFGLIVGSFLNAVIHRLHTGESVVARHSRCPRCHHELSAADLIPLVSFALLRGRCRYCRKPISWQYPAVELATALSFILIYVSSPSPFLPPAWGRNFFFSFPPLVGGIEGGGLQFIASAVFTCFLIIIFVYDLRHYLILDKIIFPAAALALLYAILQDRLVEAFLGAAILAGFFGFLFIISRGRWIGFGDVKLGVFLGLLIPFPETLVLFFLAYLTGAVVGLLLIASRSKSLRSRLPFGTFLTFAAFVAMLYGNELVDWYFGLVGLK